MSEGSKIVVRDRFRWKRVAKIAELKFLMFWIHI